MRGTLVAQLDRSVRAVSSLRDDVETIATICEKLITVLAGIGTIYTAGNGGSATHALHLAEELIGRYRTDRPPLRAVCLNADPTAMTCIANDFGFENVFARQCRALVGPDDALCVFSTSGASMNVVRALDEARAAGALTVGFLGRDGGAARTRCDEALVVAAQDAASIQDAHQVVLHLICEAIENSFGVEP